jgi:hypothetical protein
MSRYQGGMIGSVANTPSGTAYTGRANGVFPLPQQIVAKSSSLWAIGQTVPNAPTIGTATGTGATSISVAFIPPVQNGGSTITSYTVTSSGGQTATGGSSPIVVTGLTTGTSYTFTVTATNALGTSVSSGTSNSVLLISDPYFSSVSLLLNGDTLTDLSSSPKTITNNGSVTVNTTTKKYGTGSMAFSGSNYLTANAGSLVAMGTGDYTVEFWFYQTSVPGNQAQMFDTRNAYLNGIIVANGTNRAPYFYSGNSYVISSVITNLNQWYHIAAVRSGTTMTMYLNGVNVGSATSTDNIVGTNCYIGQSYDLYQATFGYIDDLRITKGVARYTSNFTPPTASFPTF